MGFFDMLAGKATNQLRNATNQAINKAVTNSSNKTEKIIFSAMPMSYEEFTSLPQAEMKTPFDTAALTVLAFCFYSSDREMCLKMLDFLRGPRPLSPMDKSFIADRFRDKDYVPRSYFNGATPDNDYMPTEPYTIEISENPYSYDNQGMAKLFVRSGGADSPRSIELRKAKDGKWYLWEQYIY
jgi:hypothetical protein